MKNEIIEEQNIEQITEAEPGKEMSIVDVLRAENERLKSEIRAGVARDELTGRLAKAGVWAPGLMFSAVAGDLKFDDEGTVLNGAAVVEKLKRDFPESFVSGSRPGTIDGGAGFTRGNALTKDALSKMSPEEIRKLDWEDVRRVLSER